MRLERLTRAVDNRAARQRGAGFKNDDRSLARQDRLSSGSLCCAPSTFASSPWPDRFGNSDHDAECRHAVARSPSMRLILPTRTGAAQLRYVCDGGPTADALIDNKNLPPNPAEGYSTA